jgi:hypothetical protein
MTLNAVFPNGLGESSADSIAVNAPFYTTGNVWYVNATTGTDAASPAGQNRMNPLATIGQAYTNSASGDVIVLMDGHTQTLTAKLTVAKRLLIVGGGQSDGKPTVKLTLNAAADNLLEFTVAGCELRNVWIEENAQTNTVPRVSIEGHRFRMRNCYVECGATDTGAGVYVEAGVNTAEIESCTFVSTATSRSAQPLSALQVGGSVTDLVIRECTFDGGTVGFSRYHAIDGGGGIVTALNMENVTFLRGADAAFVQSTTGWVAGVTSTESALISFNEDDPA